jgi:hypothetical protein
VLWVATSPLSSRWLTFVGLLSNVRSSVCPSILHLSSCHPTSYVLTFYVLLSYVLHLASCALSSYVLRPAVLCTVLSSYLFIQHLFDFRPTFVQLSLDICLTFAQHLLDFRATFVGPLRNVCWTFAQRLLDLRATFVERGLFPTTHCIIRIVFLASVVYYHKILGHKTTPCPRMMRALPLGQNLGISYEVTHNCLSRFL